MLDELKCALFSLGVGMVVGAVLTVNNKKVQSAVKQMESKAEEQIEKAKDGIGKMKSQSKKPSSKNAKKKVPTPQK